MTPPAQPRPAKGGIKAQTKRGAFGQSWWPRRWIPVLEGFNIAARLERGRNHVRRGQALSTSIAEGEVAAKGQGTRPTPYSVTVQMKTLARAAWEKVVSQLSGQAIHAANLLSGRMPDGIEDVFKAAVPAIAAALPRRLGAFPFWRGAQPFLEEMERTYALASLKGLHAFLGEP